jgi:hypothetical protein
MIFLVSPLVVLVVLLVLACAWTGAHIHERSERQLSYDLWQRQRAGERMPAHMWLPDNHARHVREFEAEAARRGQVKEPPTEQWSWYIDLDT